MSRKLALLVAMLTMVGALAAQEPASAPNVVRWQPSGDTIVVDKMEMKVVTADGVSVAAALHNMWEATTAAKLAVTNSSDKNVAVENATIELVKKKKQVAAIPAEKAAVEVRRKIQDAQMSGVGVGIGAKGPGSHYSEKARQAEELKKKTDLVVAGALAENIPAKTQVMGNLYFPHQKKLEGMVLRVTLGGTTYEFPFD